MIVKFLDRVYRFLGYFGDKRVVISIIVTVVLFGTLFALKITRNVII